MAVNMATGQDLTTRSLRTLTSQEVTVGTVWLEDAWNILLARVPSIATRLDQQSPDPVFRSLVVQIQVAMVLRVLNNPSGKLEESVDDYRYRLDQAVSTGALYVSDAEVALLSAGDDVSEGAFTIRPAGHVPNAGYWADTTTWVPYQ
jgi:hypothetical protein